MAMSMFFLSRGRYHLSRSSSSLSSSSSPPPDRPEGLEKYVCFRVYNYQGLTEWYGFNLSNNDFKCYKKKKRKRMKENRKRRHASQRIEAVSERSIVHQHHHHRGDREVGMGILHPLCFNKGTDSGCCIALGSFVYLLGGIVKEHHKVRCLDVTGCWTQGPPMLSARLLPHAVVLDGKLYVMGGLVAVGMTRNPGPRFSIRAYKNGNLFLHLHLAFWVIVTFLTLLVLILQKRFY